MRGGDLEDDDWLDDPDEVAPDPSLRAGVLVVPARAGKSEDLIAGLESYVADDPRCLIIFEDEQ